MSNPTHANRTRNAGKITLHKPATVRKASAALRSLTEEQRRTMIAEAAYYVAERRGFDACSYASIVRWVCVLGVSVVLGCTLPRRDAPPTLFSSAAPVGFPGTVRFLSVDRATVEARSDAALQGLKKASKDGVVRFLALSGGGAAGAFGAGTLIGLGHRDERPQYDVVTGVSAGALIAPFAFLGSEWDSQLADAITSGRSEHMTLHGLAQLLFGVRHRSDALLSFVDHYITKDLVDAVAKEAAAGRILWVATTALDKEELVIWDMGIIAQHGGEAARKLFRDVLVASASVPGVFSPIIIHVEKNGVRYDEMHVDGNASASLFVAPAAAYFAVLDQSALEGAQLYVLINGKIIGAPSTTRFKLGPIVGRSFDAAMKHLSRGQVIAVNQFADKYHMSVHSTLPALRLSSLQNHRLSRVRNARAVQLW